MILPHYAGRVAAPQALHRIRGIFSFLGKRISPFDPQEKGIFIASEQLEEVRRLPIALPARGVAALDVAIRFAAASIIRCRFACDSLPLRNFRLLQICTNLPLPAKAALLALAAIYALSVDGD